MNGKKLIAFFVFLALVLSVAACGDRPVRTRTVEEPAPPDVAAILAGATELRDERIYLVTLCFAKKQFTLDPWEHVKNAAAADYKTLVVGEKAYDEYVIGREISSVDDVGGFIFNGEIASYTITPSEKKIVSQYFWQSPDNSQTEISKEQYNEALKQLHTAGRQIVTVPFAGSTRTYILEKPIGEYPIVEHEPLSRFFITVVVQNSTWSLSLSKQIRNAANTHEITLEVPREVYEKTGDLWDSKINGGSLAFKGHLSELQGKVKRKWAEVDPKFSLVKTEGDRQLILPQ